MVNEKMGMTFIVLMAIYSNVIQNFDIDDIMEQWQYVCNRSGKIGFFNLTKYEIYLIDTIYCII